MPPRAEKTLEQYLPEGQVVNRAWLKARGFNRPRVSYALRAGKLEPGPMAELLAPQPQDITPLYRTEFAGLTYEPLELE